jgi:DNA-nicking Smr family endonuclease
MKDRRHRRPAPPVADPAQEQELFLQAMAQLAEVPDKDLSPKKDPAAVAVRRLKAPKKLEAAPEASLDLHGKSAEKARRALEAFVQRSAGQGLRLVLVITGKGLSTPQSSPGPKGVLKAELETWVRRHGARHLQAFSEAPRSLGGAGAYLLHLRR